MRDMPGSASREVVLNSRTLNGIHSERVTYQQDALERGTRAKKKVKGVARAKVSRLECTNSHSVLSPSFW